MPFNAPDNSHFPGMIREFTDGSGWTGADTVKAKLEGWGLHVGAAGVLPVRRIGKSNEFGTTTDALPIVLEQALSGNQLAYKALYLMSYNDSRYAEFIPAVIEMGKTYETTDTSVSKT